MSAQPRIIHTGRNGELHDDPQAVDAIFDELKHARRVVLHFHGGLVSEADGRAVAASLDPVYRSVPGTVPVFFVWESGLLEVLRHNLPEIVGEDFFKVAFKWVLKFTIGKFAEGAGGGRTAAGTLDLPTDMQLYEALAVLDEGREPFDASRPPAALPEVDAADEAQIRAALMEDLDFRETVQAITESVLPATAQEDGGRGLVTRSRRSGRSLMSPEIIEELAADAQVAQQQGARGILSSAKMVWRLTQVLHRVISRFRSGRDHGVYPTIVEEMLREFYLANVGVAVWSAMKKETADTFGQGPKLRGGSYTMRKLQQMLMERAATDGAHDVEVTLVGHSTGAVFINNLLAHIEQRRADPHDPFPAGFRFRNVVFLAPACTFADFHAVVSTPQKDLFENFQMFTMYDRHESEDQLVPHVYTRSLLYFISGVLEPDADGNSAPDVPVVGMERYYTSDTYGTPEIVAVRTFVGSAPSTVVWSPTDSGPLRSGALKHGIFDDDGLTRASLTAIIEGRS